MIDRRHGRWQFSLSFMMAVMLACTLSCSREEQVDAYLESLQMAPPQGEPPSFEIVGHRGYGLETPENTLAALSRSIKEGVRFAEVDVRLTSDGVPVLLHDDSLLRTTGDPHLVDQLTLAQVKKLDAGSYTFIEFRDERIPTLDEVLRLCRGRLKLILHMKLPHSGPIIAAAIHRTAFPERDAWLMSDQLNTLAEMRRLLPGAKLVHLVYRLPKGRAAQDAFIQEQAQYGATRAALALEVPDEEYMIMARRAGINVLFWTADHPYDSQQVDRFTADGVITNKPLMWKDWAARIRNGKQTLLDGHPVPQG